MPMAAMCSGIQDFSDRGYFVRSDARVHPIVLIMYADDAGIGSSCACRYHIIPITYLSSVLCSDFMPAAALSPMPAAFGGAIQVAIYRYNTNQAAYNKELFTWDTLGCIGIYRKTLDF